MIYFFQLEKPQSFQNLQQAKEAKVGIALSGHTNKVTVTRKRNDRCNEHISILDDSSNEFCTVPYMMHYTPASILLKQKHQPFCCWFMFFDVKYVLYFHQCIDGAVGKDVHLGMAKPSIYIYIYTYIYSNFKPYGSTYITLYFTYRAIHAIVVEVYVWMSKADLSIQNFF